MGTKSARRVNLHLSAHLCFPGYGVLIKKPNLHPCPGFIKSLRYCCLKMVWHYTWLEVDTEELYENIPSPLSLETQHQMRLNTDLPSCPDLKFYLFSFQRKENGYFPPLCSGFLLLLQPRNKDLIRGMVWMGCIANAVLNTFTWESSALVLQLC